MIDDILPLIPEHVTYVEPFFGGGAIFWAKIPSEIEVINDINGNVVNFYRVLKTKPKMLTRMIVGTPHSRSEYEKAMKVLRSRDSNVLRRAWAFWMTTQHGFSGGICGWAYGIKKNRNSKVKGKRDFFETNYRMYAERLAKVQIECEDALSVIERYDSANTFFYIDPPYVGAFMNHYRGYKFKDFRNLIELLKKIKGKFILSIGDVGAEIVRKMQVDWIELCFVKQMCAPLKRDKVEARMEYVFMNFDHKNDFNLTLFDGVEDAKWI